MKLIYPETFKITSNQAQYAYNTSQAKATQFRPILLALKVTVEFVNAFGQLEKWVDGVLINKSQIQASITSHLPLLEGEIEYKPTRIEEGDEVNLS